MKPTKVIGIAGGLGPYAHIDFERKLLDAARIRFGAQADQDFPEWILSSVPGTPDRTLAIASGGDDPRPWLLRSLQRLERAGADFVCVPCNTAHRYFSELGPQIGIPVVDMIDCTVAAIRERFTSGCVGILATTGTLRSNLYRDRLSAAGLNCVSPLDAEDGEALQQRLVMEPIYGGACGLGIKAEGPMPKYAALLGEAADQLVRAHGAQAIVAGCTEIPLVLTGETVAGVPVIDPTGALAERAIDIAYGAVPVA